MVETHIISLRSDLSFGHSQRILCGHSWYVTYKEANLISYFLEVNFSKKLTDDSPAASCVRSVAVFDCELECHLKYNKFLLL